MFRFRLQGTLLVLALAASLAIPQEGSARSLGRERSPRERHVTFTTWDVLIGFWHLHRGQAKEGCGLDPHGSCANSQGSPPGVLIQPNSGSGMTPPEGHSSEL
jgi:hypothetical protein